MSDYISREASIDDICSRLNWSDLEGNPIPQKDIRVYIADLINHVPAADVRPVVLCRDCKHRDPEDHKCDSGEVERQGCPFEVADDYFCAYGEKREES